MLRRVDPFCLFTVLLITAFATHFVPPLRHHDVDAEQAAKAWEQFLRDQEEFEARIAEKDRRLKAAEAERRRYIVQERQKWAGKSTIEMHRGLQAEGKSADDIRDIVYGLPEERFQRQEELYRDY